MTEPDLAQPSLAALFAQTKIRVRPEIFVIVGVPLGDWSIVLAGFSQAPPRWAAFNYDDYEVTLITSEPGWQSLADKVTSYQLETGYRLLTLDVVLPWNVVGFLAAVSTRLAQTGISLGVITAYSRDHLLIKETELEKALAALADLGMQRD